MSFLGRNPFPSTYLPTYLHSKAKGTTRQAWAQDLGCGHGCFDPTSFLRVFLSFSKPVSSSSLRVTAPSPSQHLRPLIYSLITGLDPFHLQTSQLALSSAPLRQQLHRASPSPQLWCLTSPVACICERCVSTTGSWSPHWLLQGLPLSSVPSLPPTECCPSLFLHGDHLSIYSRTRPT